METSAHGITAPSAVYEVGGRRFDCASCGFAEALIDAHAAHQRPRCLCVAEGVEMYLARLGDRYIVKRMPGTGSHHAHDCQSYEPPTELFGMGQVLGSAITEDPITGETTLKLDFPLTKRPERFQQPPAGGDSNSVAAEGTRLSLRGLLHYLWDQSELTHWHPGFAGRRTWATVRRHLLQAAHGKTAGGQVLQERMYIPEPFTVEQREQINARRLALWKHAMPQSGGHRGLMLLIGEVKEIESARYGYKAVIKHIPDQPFLLDAQLYRRMARRFKAELSIWGASDAVHMVLIGTVGLNSAGMPAFDELSLMPVNAQWLPFENIAELQLFDRLVREGRRFTKGLRYNLSSCEPVASAVLLDAADSTLGMWVATDHRWKDFLADTLYSQTGLADLPGWIWNVWEGTMPELPALR
jgi:hypothetical protein